MTNKFYNQNNFFSPGLLIGMFCLVIGLLAIRAFDFYLPVEAYVASSTNYRLERESLNFGGGYATSTNYSLRDTLGEVGTGTSTSASYRLYAGYRQTLADEYVAITLATDIDLGSLPGLGGGTASGNQSWTVTTDSQSGYLLSVRASADPAMQGSSEDFADYSPAGAAPDFNFIVGSAAAVFGFTPTGDDIATRFLDDGADCDTGVLNTADRCWDGLSTSDETIATRNNSNHPAGTATGINFQAGLGADKVIPAGNYQATVIVTAVTN
ncbi:MAG: hypothetical protein WDZ85_00395 [Candidatus Paceibacterota bacterium]